MKRLYMLSIMALMLVSTNSAQAGWFGADWKPVLDINAVIYGLIYLFYEPNANDPLNKQAAKQLREKPNEFKKMVELVRLTKRTIGKIDYRIVGHSAGGSTIKRLGITGDLCRLSPSMVVWSDSSYGLWLKNSWDGCLENHRDILVKVFVAKGDSPWRRATQFMGEFHELCITEGYKDNFASIDTLLPNYRNTLLYFRFEEANQ